MHFTTVTSVALLALGVSAGAINKRTAEGVHLANCYQQSALGPVPFSQFLYYADDAQASEGVDPSSSDKCHVNKPGAQGFRLWEGQAITCTFPSHVTFTSNIESGAGSYSVGTFAG